MGKFNILVLLTVVTGLAYAQNDQKTSSGIAGNDITLSCDLDTTDATEVLWTDWVYNSDRNPIDIYASARDSISTDHPNAADMMVDPDTFALTIKNLETQDYGEYICTTVMADGSETEFKQSINVIERPVCSDDIDVMEGEAAKAICSINFSGDFPQLDWYKGEEMAEFETVIDVTSAKIELRLDADWLMDNSVYTCRLRTSDGMVEECMVNMAVTYQARDLQLTPAAGSPLQVGSKVMCRAMGNPEPTIEFEASGADLPQISERSGQRHFIVPQAWQGLTVDITCTAKNDLGDSAALEKADSYDVIAPTTSVPEPEPEPTDVPVTKSGSANMAGILAAVVICALVIVVIIIAVIILRRRNSNRRPPAGSKQVPTKEELMQSENGNP